MPAVISDTSALNYLARLGQFELLRLEFQRVFVPPAVQAELMKRPDLPGWHCVQQALTAGWLEIRFPQNQGEVIALREDLGAGEAEAIALARELPSALLLMDEAYGRAIAAKLNIGLIGTAGVLLRARKAGAILQLKPLLDELVNQHGFRLSQKLYQDALREAGELP